jgi:AraC-like DNA-binding protein
VAPEITAARKRLHDLFYLPAPVQRVAAEVGLAAETLTRRFSQAYKLSPKQYCHRARLFAAVLRLLAGGAILETALAVGFNDLSRFYQQFRRLLGATPGTYAAIRKRQDPPAGFGDL